MLKEILLLGKKILVDKSEIVFEYHGVENFKDYFDVKLGEWTYQDGCLIGKELENRGGIIYANKKFDYDVMMTFKVSTVLPATRDLNAVWCSEWDDGENYLGNTYVCGLNGWYEGKAGIERSGENEFYSGTTLYNYQPGEEVEITCGSINGHCFMLVNDVLVCEYKDNFPLIGGYVGISPYCTCLKISDLVVRKIEWEKRKQRYLPEF
ncbi:MAG: hypothetical protein IJX78_07480 [Bacilli bacterium]|nr:hypothetical protein [Bacilli bacterium]